MTVTTIIYRDRVITVRAFRPNGTTTAVVRRDRVIVAKVGVPGPPGPAGNGNALITGIAGEPLGGHRMVTTNASGHYVHASNANPAHAGRVVGITTGAAAQGATVTIQPIGSITESAWAWVPESVLFLGANGQLSATPPASGFVQIIGYAQTATTIYLQLYQPFLR